MSATIPRVSDGHAVEQPVDHGACAGRTYLERGLPVLVERGWRGRGPRNVLVRREDGTRVVRPFRGLRVGR